MNLQKLSPYIRLATDMTIPPPWRLKERVLFDYELLYVKEGEIRVTIEGHRYHGIPGDVFLFRPKQRHSLEIIGNKPFRQPHIHFDLFYQEDSPNIKVSFKPLEELSIRELGFIREDILTHSSIQIVSHIRLQNPLFIEKMIMEIVKEYEMKLPYYEINIKGMFTQLWVQLVRENYWSQHPQLSSNIERLSNVRDYLKNHPERKVTLEELSEISNISKYYLITLFKKAFDMTPIQYQQMIRIEKAKELIQFTAIPLTEIADKFGFHNIHTFSRAFKNAEGVSPSFYRKT
jgi:AraC-like DNA-binding protein